MYLSHLTGNRDTHIASTPNTVSVNYGETAVLPCKINNLKRHKVEPFGTVSFCNVLFFLGNEIIAPWYERSLTERWVVGSILHGVDPLSYFSFQPVLHDWCNKGRGMYYGGMVHIKEPLLLIEKSSLCGGSGFPLSLSEWSFTI